MYEYLLPLGSVVRVSDGQVSQNYLIVGYLPESGAGERRDYAAVRYPMGAIGPGLFFFFDHSAVSEIIALGYEDDEAAAMKKLLEQAARRREAEGEAER